ncbi:MAG: OadG family protein [bacterium]|jgi:sodium pump decarboxylase gamma subunit
MGNSLMYGVQVTVIGMLVVFISLIGLSFIMEILRHFFGVKEKILTKEKLAPPSSALTAEVGGEETGNDDVPQEVVAAISSAITAYLNTTPRGVKIKIVRRAQAPAFSAWSMAGRQEQMNLR